MMSFRAGLKNYRTTILGTLAGICQVLATLDHLTLKTALPAVAVTLLGLFAKDAGTP